MARVYLTKTFTGFAPADEASKELWQKYKTGQIYRADIVKPRSYQHHKLCMALIAMTYENLPERYHQIWPTPKQFRRMLADAIGHVEQFVSKDGEVKTQALSLSYDDVPDDVEFGRLFGEMMVVCAHFLGMENLWELEAQVSQYAALHYGMAA